MNKLTEHFFKTSTSVFTQADVAVSIDGVRFEQFEKRADCVWQHIPSDVDRFLDQLDRTIRPIAESPDIGEPPTGLRGPPTPWPLEVVAACRHRATEFSWSIWKFLPSSGGLNSVEIAAHEWIGLAWYWMKGRI